jgi:bud site selection protein 31
MPKVSGRKKFPRGWDAVADTLAQLNAKMREGPRRPATPRHAQTHSSLARPPALRAPAAESHDDEKVRKHEIMWPILQINHQRSRYIYEMFYERRAISREVYEFALKEGYADAGLIAKWKKQGFERLCCVKCSQPLDTNNGTVCICRVPKKNMGENDKVQCVNCGCTGCASSD